MRNANTQMDYPSITSTIPILFKNQKTKSNKNNTIEVKNNKNMINPTAVKQTLIYLDQLINNFSNGNQPQIKDNGKIYEICSI